MAIVLSTGSTGGGLEGRDARTHHKKTARQPWLSGLAHPSPGGGRSPGGAMRARHDAHLVRRTERSGSRAPRRRPVILALVVLLLGGVLAALPLASSSAATAPPTVSSGTDPANGFPLWYQDNTGTRVASCLDPADANCIVAGDAGFDPAKPTVFPTNFPSEFFYLNAQSDRLATPGCKGAKAGRISILSNLEGAFANGAPKFGDQMVFGRVRLILTGGLCPKATYQVTAPYGSFSFTTDTNGGLPAPLTITAVTLAGTVDFTASAGTCTVAVAPGRTCQVNVTFTARAPAGNKATTLTFVSNAATSPVVPVTGTSK